MYEVSLEIGVKQADGLYWTDRELKEICPAVFCCSPPIPDCIEISSVVSEIKRADGRRDWRHFHIMRSLLSKIAQKRCIFPAPGMAPAVKKQVLSNS
jgi:hypothetical protein